MVHLFVAWSPAFGTASVLIRAETHFVITLDALTIKHNILVLGKPRHLSSCHVNATANTTITLGHATQVCF